MMSNLCLTHRAELSKTGALAYVPRLPEARIGAGFHALRKNPSPGLGSSAWTKRRRVNILWFLIIGLVVGLIARSVVPGKDSMGLISTTVLGILGSVIGGGLAVLFTGRDWDGFTTAGLGGSIVGAIVALLIYRRMN